MAKRGRKEKDNWKKKRRQEYLEKKEFRYYIFCEGQATEPKYFQGFKRYIEENPIYRDMVLIEINFNLNKFQNKYMTQKPKKVDRR